MPYTSAIKLKDHPDMETGKEDPARISPTSLRFVIDANGAPVIAQVLGPVRRPEGELRKLCQLSLTCDGCRPCTSTDRPPCANGRYFHTWDR